ncbi:hypothetical protein PUN28_000507 [Cardiocondyla obscurior]|uniref:Ribosomal protein S10 n=1 Tax=Cardiocondyla obscurior TaxID=286306 RepID=A0AAW2GZW2_9HYME
MNAFFKEIRRSTLCLIPNSSQFLKYKKSHQMSGKRVKNQRRTDLFKRGVHTIMIVLHLQVSSFNHTIVFHASSSRSDVSTKNEKKTIKLNNIIIKSIFMPLRFALEDEFSCFFDKSFNLLIITETTRFPRKPNVALASSTRSARRDLRIRLRGSSNALETELIKQIAVFSRFAVTEIKAAQVDFKRGTII